MYTTADADLKEIEGLLEKAIHKMGRIVSGETWGADDYTEDYRFKIREAYHLLLDVRDKMKVRT